MFLSILGKDFRSKHPFFNSKHENEPTRYILSAI